MKKNRFLSILLLGAFILTFAAGCTTKSSSVSSEPSRTPSKQEIATAVKNMENWSTLGKTFKKMVKQIFQLTLGGKLKSEAGMSIGDIVKSSLSGNMDSSALMQKMGEYYSIDATGQKTYTNISQLTRVVTSTGSLEGAYNRPIIIAKNATITKGDGTKEIVNVVGLNGLFSSQTKSTSLATAIYMGCQVQNEYLYDIYYAIYNTLKGDEATPLYIVGMSLGGMAAQQIAGLDNLTNYFNVKYVVSIASPMISPDDIDYSKTTVRRMVDVDDIVPQLSASFNGDYQSKYKEKNYAIVRNSEYDTFFGSHTFGYCEEELWGDVDVLGYENGGATITINWDNVTWHNEPETDKALAEEAEKIQS